MVYRSNKQNHLLSAQCILIHFKVCHRQETWFNFFASFGKDQVFRYFSAIVCRTIFVSA